MWMWLNLGMACGTHPYHLRPLLLRPFSPAAPTPQREILRHQPLLIFPQLLHLPAQLYINIDLLEGNRPPLLIYIAQERDALGEHGLLRQQV